MPLAFRIRAIWGKETVWFCTARLLTLGAMQTLQGRPLIFTAEGVLDDAECDDWIAWAEERGFHQGALIGEQGVTWDDEVRNNDRMMVDDFSKASLLVLTARVVVPEAGRLGGDGLQRASTHLSLRPGTALPRAP